MRRLTAYKLIIAAIILYLSIDLFFPFFLDEELVYIAFGGANGILIIAGLLCAIGAIRLNRGNLTYQRMRFTKREFPQTYRYLMTFFLLGMCTSLGIATYSSLDRSDTISLVASWLTDALSYFENLIRSFFTAS